MPRCPHCMAPMSGRFSICETCGRIVSGASGLQSRISRTSSIGGVQPTPRARKGPAPGSAMGGRPPPVMPAEVRRRQEQMYRQAPNEIPRRLVRRKRERRNATVALLLVAVMLFTPAQDPLMDGFDEYFNDIFDLMTPSHEHPVEAEYTFRSTYQFESGPNTNGSDFMYKLPIPSPKRTSYGYESVMFSSTDGTQIPSEVLQNIVEMKVGVSIPSENIPLNPGAVREKSNAIQMADGYSQIWWPAPGGSEAEDCQYGRCLIWEGTIPAATQNEIDNNPTRVIATLVVDYTIHSFAYSWWQDADLPSNVLGMTGGNGISKSTSGTFSDLDNIGIQYYTNAFGDKTQFYDRSGGGSDYAIDAESSIVIEIADMIQSSLPPEDQDNVFAFSHAAFIWVRDNIQYAKGLETARSGPACIQAEKGDCDEQSNAWMSIVRTKRVSTWYEMGILGSGDFSQWEAHGWSNIALPLSEETCNERNIEPTSCYIIGAVDVVNNKWLLYTPTVYSNFIQKATHSSDDVDSVYTRIYYGHTMKSFDHSYSTVGTPLVTDGTFMVNWKEGE
ncbi:MAG: hypothetical protein CL977_02895 [Euryarchaeota archaeon]|nr:hypothetical protein [Euryarchaeota archaeon]